ncbi:MAG: recombination protein RecR [Chlamydiae bacterium]|nr:recombination protein RecR [Chlamydiota bacterium]
MRYPEPILNLVAHLQKLPGIGRKTAEKFAFHLLDWEKVQLDNLAYAILNSKDKLHRCDTCNGLHDKSVCPFCDADARASQTLCIVSSPKHIYAIESTHLFEGVYHVLSRLISPIENRYVEEEELKKIKDRIVDRKIEEVIIALDATLEGDATALFLRQQLKELPVSISRLAHGLPIGGSLEYVDEETLHLALRGRVRL